MAEYTDEAVSAFSASRGPGLVDAMGHAQELAQEHGSAELWAQHSDRLARGDGKTARHAVEVALWALKHDVKIHTLQDPDTFRDLLYAVVTGQRNHEDSRRKGLAVAAGRRRVVARGDYTGSMPDGYRRVVEVDEAGVVKKRLDIDPERRELIETIFAMALRGRRLGAIASAVNEAGWLTNPRSARGEPKAWGVQRVLDVLRNPFYAGLAVGGGEVVGRGHWPAYVSEREHCRLQRGVARPRPTWEARRFEPYLLSRLARCGRCGTVMHHCTSQPRDDGTFPRRYLCASHSGRNYTTARCPAVPIDADVIEAMFVSAIGTLLAVAEEEEADAPYLPDAPARQTLWSESRERRRVLDAMAVGDDARIDATLQALFARMAPEAAAMRRMGRSDRHARRAALVERLQGWTAEERAGRTDVTRGVTRELNQVLRRWFSSILLTMDGRGVTLVAQRLPSAGGGKPPEPVRVCFYRREWIRLSAVTGHTEAPPTRWEDAELIDALKAWADAHGRCPKITEWPCSPECPSSQTIRKRFGSWPRALRRAGLKPAASLLGHKWTDEEILEALRVWTERHGYPPKTRDWLGTGPGRPCRDTVRNRFGSWRKGLAAAGVAEGRKP